MNSQAKGMKYSELEALSTALFGAVIAANEAIETYPPAAQEYMAVEEMGELLTAIARRSRGRSTNAEIVDEAADVIIMSLQMGLMFSDGGTDELTDAITAKWKRLENRIEALKKPADSDHGE